MRAARFHEFGGPEVLQVEIVDDPVAGPGDVVLTVSACALNHFDVDLRAGVSRIPFDPPFTPGIEVVGRIAEIGQGVEGWELGTRVMPYLLYPCNHCRYCRTGRENLCVAPGFVSFSTTGGYAEKLRCPAAQLIRVPDEIPDETAAALQVAFATAWHMLFARARVTAGESILINSVGGGVGSAALQLAKHVGAYVIGTASSDEKLEKAAALGMDAGINYGSQDVAEQVLQLTGGTGVDVAVDHAGGEGFQRALDALCKDGRLVTCGAHGGEVVPFDIVPFFRDQKSIISSFAYTSTEVEHCLDLTRRGLIHPIVDTVFPLDQARAATEALERREHFGKILLKP